MVRQHCGRARTTSALRLAAGTAHAKASLTRLAVALGLLLIALILVVAALAFALCALDGYLATFLSDPAAAAITAAITLALAAIIAAAVLWRAHARLQGRWGGGTRHAHFCRPGQKWA